MKFEIKHRWNESILFSGEFGSLKLCVEAAVSSRAYLADANLADADLTGANLAGAYLARADLADANLARADLTRANLADAYLARANLADAYLARADLTGANLADANLAGAYLARADLTRANLADACGLECATPEESDATLAQIAEIVLARPERLAMEFWHGFGWDYTHTPDEERSCGTPHCMAGWAQALCPVPAIRRMDPQRAGLMLIPTAAHMFYKTDAEALAFLEAKRRPAHD